MSYRPAPGNLTPAASTQMPHSGTQDAYFAGYPLDAYRAPGGVQPAPTLGSQQFSAAPAYQQYSATPAQYDAAPQPYPPGAYASLPASAGGYAAMRGGAAYDPNAVQFPAQSLVSSPPQRIAQGRPAQPRQPAPPAQSPQASRYVFAAYPPPAPTAPPPSGYRAAQERPHQCDLCPLSFQRHHDFQRHRATHKGDKPFACPDCHRSFTRRDALKRHQDSTKGRCADSG